MTELKLERGVPVEVTPGGAFAVVQNTMRTADDKLMVSVSGTIDEKWMSIGAGGAVKFDQPMFFMQTSWDTVVLPVIEGA